LRIPEKRIIEVKDLIKKEKVVTVERLTKAFGISPITARRDLERLDKEGFLTKVHGGAIYKDIIEPEPVFSEQVKKHREEKSGIAAEAVKRISDGDIIVLESGSTCLAMVEHLASKKDIKVSTAGIPLANELWKLSMNKKDIGVSICGGQIRPDSSIFVGPHAIDFFNSINADIAFVSPVGVSVEKGISTATELDAELMKAIMGCAHKKILICDSTKFGKYSYINVAPLSDFTEIITDKGLDNRHYNKVKDKGIKITLV
jgi:DeoR family transcriptional regulator of aga operon/DeoR family myo-inositol catabolism operon transcriptional repressor